MSALPVIFSADHAPVLACRPLDQVRTGMMVRILRLGTEASVSQRLREMGLGENQLVRLVSKYASVICQVCSSRLALSATVAAQILVEPVLVSGRPG